MPITKFEVKQCLNQGAVGMKLGLIYLCSGTTLAKHGGMALIPLPMAEEACRFETPRTGHILIWEVPTDDDVANDRMIAAAWNGLLHSRLQNPEDLK